jgi:predicted hotdog family 3-hydroxylacyl-ACP dehydratase
MLIGKEELRTLVPHAGLMCLLDGVERWDEEEIVCLSETHLRTDNPLRRGGRLGAVHAVEYGAQAMAVHGGLLSRRDGGAPAAGFLAALRDVVLNVVRLDDLAAPLRVTARRLMASGGNMMYVYSITTTDDRPVASARATVAVQPGP